MFTVDWLQVLQDLRMIEISFISIHYNSLKSIGSSFPKSRQAPQRISRNLKVAYANAHKTDKLTAPIGIHLDSCSARRTLVFLQLA